ncbi:MAG: hypothetical protein IPL74_05910 [Bacteroidetes bacterium]|nr:hypothetical protein [Bacteroidota bacterium]
MADNSTFLNICGNTVEKMGFAMQFEGDCQFSELKNNTIKDYTTGINYINAKFTPQGNSSQPWDNKWIQTNTNTSLIKVDGILIHLVVSIGHSGVMICHREMISVLIHTVLML